MLLEILDVVCYARLLEVRDDVRELERVTVDFRRLHAVSVTAFRAGAATDLP